MSYSRTALLDDLDARTADDDWYDLQDYDATDPHAARLAALHQTFTETAHELGVGILPPAPPPRCPVHGGLLHWCCRRGAWFCAYEDDSGFCGYEQRRA